MADHYYSVVLGDESPDEVTVGTSTSSEAIELRVQDGLSLTKVDVIKALDTLKNYIVVNNVPA